MMLANRAGYVNVLRASLRPPPPKKIMRIMPTVQGTGSGDSWANAGSMANLNSFISIAGETGGEVWIRADAGTYADTTREIRAGGRTSQRPVSVLGVDVNGAPMNARIIGTRADPWTAGAANGNSTGTFLLLTGATHLIFKNLRFENCGLGCFRVGGPVANLTIEDCQGDNVREFFANTTSGAVGGGVATIAGFTMRNVVVNGWSKRFARVQYDSSNILIEDCIGDSERQDGDNFAAGIVFDHTAHDIIVRRSVMRNCIDTLHTYQNGDGFGSERGNYNILMEDCEAYNCTDGGFDFKSDTTLLLRCIARENHRNFRLWGDAELRDCQASNPIDNAGANPYQRANISTFQNSIVRVYGGTYSQVDTHAAFRLEKGSMLSVNPNVTVVKPSGAPLTFVEGAVGSIPAAQYQTMPVNDTTPPTITSATSYTIAENKSGSFPQTANKFAQLRVAGGPQGSQFSTTSKNLVMQRQDYEALSNPVIQVDIFMIDGSGNRSATRRVSVTITDVADDPIGPAELKALGATGGAWIEIHPDYCWEDVDRTIRATVGGPVARVDDRMGFGNDMILEDPLRPATLMSSDGNYYLDFDGYAGPYLMGEPGALNFSKVSFATMIRRDPTDTATRYLIIVPRSTDVATASNFRWGLSVLGGTSWSIKLAPVVPANSTDSYTSSGGGATVGENRVLSFQSETGIGRANTNTSISGVGRPTMSYPVKGQAKMGAQFNDGARLNAFFYGLVITNTTLDPTVLFRVERQMGLLAGLNL